MFGFNFFLTLSVTEKNPINRKMHLGFWWELSVLPQLQQGQVKGPVSGEEQPHASVQAWGGPAGLQLCGEGPGSAG